MMISMALLTFSAFLHKLVKAAGDSQVDMTKAYR